MIPTAFTPFKQFINWVLIDKGKVPINAMTGQYIDPIDPDCWISADEALQHTNLGYGVGFVFTSVDPFFFLDIDDCLVGDQWSELATNLCQLFTGCYIEISYSGKGLHIFGSGEYPAHACRNSALDIEFYTADRFVALTGTAATGDASHRPQNQINWLIDNYFNPGIANSEPIGEWSSGPCAEWNGIVDDDKLIEKMLASKGAAHAFGGRASIADLWGGDTSYHSNDHSAADAALCQHLAFWTGKDCDRIDRLFRQSGLMRPKWDERRGKWTYGERTILGVVAKCTKVFGTRAESVPGELREGLQYMSVDQQVEWFNGCTYVTSMHRIFTPKGQFLKPDQFKAVYGGYVFALDNINGKASPCAYNAFTQSQGYHFPKVDTCCFRPDLPEMQTIEIGGLQMINTWLRIKVDRRPGNIDRFMAHFKAMLPDERDREILISYMASVIQQPGRKIPWMPIIQGCQGNGKSMLIKVMEHAVGERYAHTVNAADLAKNGLSFNAWIQNKLFVAFEEIYIPKRREVIEALKPLITEARVEIQAKGIDQVTGDNRANFMACTNHKDGVPKYRGDRRHCILFTAQQSEDDMVRMGWRTAEGNSTKYFSQLYDWLWQDGFAAIVDWLYNYQVKDEFCPFRTMTTAPVTSSTGHAIDCSLGGLEQDILEAVAEGRAGFVTPWLSSFALSKLIDDRRDNKRISHSKRREIAESLGYVVHPALKNGRVHSVVPGEGGKPRLYVKKDSIAIQLDDPATVLQHYLKAQGGMSPLAGATNLA